tara:strand:+ start:5782 stop:6153 length:372 start_codon:yes stop_codon:yes gene_type:complete
MELIYFILIAYGLTQIVVYGDMPLIRKLRPSKEFLKGYGKLFHCPMCMGFHVGWLLMLLSPYTELFSFDVSIANFFLLGWLSSGTSYILNMLIGDRGIKILRNVEVVKDEEWYLHDKVDDSAS